MSHSWVGKCWVKGHFIQELLQIHLDRSDCSMNILICKICFLFVSVKYCFKWFLGKKIWNQMLTQGEFEPLSRSFNCLQSRFPDYHFDIHTDHRDITPNHPTFQKAGYTIFHFCLEIYSCYSKFSLRAGFCIWRGRRQQGQSWAARSDVNVALRWKLAVWGTSGKKKM